MIDATFPRSWHGKNCFITTHTGKRIMVCTWVREICSCSCLAVLPGLPCLHSKIFTSIFFSPPSTGGGRKYGPFQYAFSCVHANLLISTPLFPRIQQIQGVLGVLNLLKRTPDVVWHPLHWCLLQRSYVTRTRKMRFYLGNKFFLALNTYVVI